MFETYSSVLLYHKQCSLYNSCTNPIYSFVSVIYYACLQNAILSIYSISATPTRWYMIEPELVAG